MVGEFADNFTIHHKADIDDRFFNGCFSDELNNILWGENVPKNATLTFKNARIEQETERGDYGESLCNYLVFAYDEMTITQADSEKSIDTEWAIFRIIRRDEGIGPAYEWLFSPHRAEEETDDKRIDDN